MGQPAGMFSADADNRFCKASINAMHAVKLPALTARQYRNQ